MREIKVEEVREETVEDLCWLCVPRERREDPAFLKGVEAKIAWVKERLASELPVAKIAYVGKEAAGLLHYQVHPKENVVQILCIFVPERQYWGQGVGTKLLATLVEEMKKPQPWNGGRRPEALLVHTFPGEIEGQLSAREFFLRRGFQQITDDPDLLVLSLVPGYRYPPSFRVETFSPPPPYLPQPEDRGCVLIISGPSFCPWVFSWYLKGEHLLREALPEAPIRWIDGVKDPEELKKRGGFTGIVVNGQALRHSVFEEEEFVKEAQEAWQKGGMR